MATQLAEQAEPEVHTEGVEQQTERDFEAEARELGWRPQEEFAGDAKHFVDAKTFVERGEQMMPFLKAQNAKLKKDISLLQSQVKKLTKAEQMAYDNAIADIKAKREEAVQTGDLDGFRKLDKQIEDLTLETQPQATREEAMEAFDTFREDNAWYDRGNLGSATEAEIDARIYFDKMCEKNIHLTAELSPADFLAHNLKLVEDKYGDKLKLKGAPRQKPQSDVAGVTRKAPSGARTGTNLPPEAKQQAERFMRSGVYKVATKQEAYDRFAKSFDWDGYTKENAR